MLNKEMKHFFYNIKDILLLCGMLGSFLFIFVSTIDGVTRPHYLSTYHLISHLGLGERSWLATSSSIVVGILYIAFSYQIKQITYQGYPLINKYFLLLGVGFIGSAIFVMDPIMDYPPGISPNFTFRGRVHEAFTILMIFSLIANSISWSRLFIKIKLYTLFVVSIIACIIMIVSLVVFVSMVLLEILIEKNKLPAGLIERIFFYTGFIWNLYISYWLYKHRNSLSY